MSARDQVVLRKDRHLKYWLRCLRTLLPHYYTSNDSSRMSLAFFTIAALDLLQYLDSQLSDAERQGYIDWIYHCQHPTGGFRGFPGTDFGSLRSEENAQWDPVNLPATYFALTTLLILGDDLTRVDRDACLSWLPRLQRADGSFGEIVGSDGTVLGGRDLRFCYCASGVRWILGGSQGRNIEPGNDIDTDKLVEYINSVETYEGGISDAPYHEAHAGYTYCAIGSLSFLGRGCEASRAAEKGGFEYMKLKCPEDTVRWLVARQTSMLVDYRDPEDDDADEPNPAAGGVMDGVWNVDLNRPASPSIIPSDDDLRWAGFTGRCNKVADTCYSFWVGGSLAILDRFDLTDLEANRRYLLEKTQHPVGGFGKLPDDPPDMYHGYLGLASLALLREPGLKDFDPTLCASTDAKNHLESLPWWG